MKPGVEFLEVCHFTERHVIEVIETMLRLPAKPVSKRARSEPRESVSGWVGFSGERLSGAVYLHCSVAFARHAAATIFGTTSAQLQVEDGIPDAMAELANLIAGGLRSWFCGKGIICALSIPALIRGTSFAVVPGPDVVRQKLHFECGADLVTVEIHIRRD